MTGTDVKVYTQRNVIDRCLREGASYISNRKFEDLLPFEVFPGDVLVTTRGTIGRTMLVTEDCERGILHPCLVRVQADPERLRAEFIMTLIQDSQLLPQQLTFLSNATTIDVIYSHTLANIVVPVPPLTEQCAIADYLERRTSDVSRAIDRVRRGVELLREYRRSLFADVVTGKLDVRDMSISLPDDDRISAEGDADELIDVDIGTGCQR